jgi:thiamine-phosphate pyrophosphorylase
VSHLARPPRPVRPILCYVTDRRSLPLSTSADAHNLLFASVERAAAAGVDWIQLREKDFSGKEWEELVQESLRRISRVGAATRLFVNDRLDVALACGAGGVHLSENGIPVSEACRLRDEFFSARSDKRDFLIGVSCHSLGASLGAARGGADYIYFSPIFQTPSKANYGPPQGLDRLATICRAVTIPVIAIGGISTENAESCLQSGAAGVAAIRMFQESQAGDLKDTLRALRNHENPPPA